MASITIKFRNGDTKHFKHAGRPGGSYTKSVKYEGGVVTITDEYYREISYPLDLVQEVISEPHNGY